MHYIMNGEYAGFFDIGMVQRNEFNAIIRARHDVPDPRAAMDKVGGWSSDTILRGHPISASRSSSRAGSRITPCALRRRAAAHHYVGLQEAAPSLGLWRLPDRQEALARFLPGAKPADAGSAPRILAGLAELARRESLGVVVAILNLIWVPIVAFADIAIPDKILTLPIIASFIVSAGAFVALTGCGETSRPARCWAP